MTSSKHFTLRVIERTAYLDQIHTAARMRPSSIREKRHQSSIDTSLHRLPVHTYSKPLAQILCEQDFLKYYVSFHIDSHEHSMAAQTQDCLTHYNVSQVLTQGNTFSSMQLAQSSMNATVVANSEEITNKRSRIQEEGVIAPLKRQRIRHVRWADKPQFVEADPDVNVGINHANIWYTVSHVICFQFLLNFLC
jgi:hypothetical protein